MAGYHRLDDLVPDWIASNASRIPDRVATEVLGESLTFRQLDTAVSLMARQLAGLGVREGDKVATVLANGRVAALLPHATVRLGATAAPLNARLTPAELQAQLRNLDARLVLVDARSATAVASLPNVAPVGIDTESAGVLGYPPLHEVPAADIELREAHGSEHVFAIVHTSGTTGRPSAAMLTVGNFLWSALSSSRNLGMLPDDRWLACMPLYHVGGLSILTRAAIDGFTSVVQRGFDAAAVNRAVDAGSVTIVSVVATMLQRMLDERSDRPFPASLRYVLAGGGSVPRHLLDRCRSLGVPLLQTYGLTESASQVATLAPGDVYKRPGSAGRALWPSSIRIASGARELPAGAEGEIQVRGPIVMAGYHNDPEGTAAKLVDGWLHTGDIGRLDEDGYLYVLDRRHDLIVSGGENVYPTEVESVLLMHDSVSEAAVLGLDDREWGARVVAIVVPAGEAVKGLPEKLDAHCRAHLAGYKVPREYLVSSEPLPRTASGKLRRGEVRELVAELRTVP